MDKQVLFLCPHNAAKSVMASAYFNKRANDEGVAATAFSAGTEPDEAVAPHVAALLDKEGYRSAVLEPKKVTPADLEKADLVISIGCDLNDLPPTGKNVTTWDDVPTPSQDLEGACEGLRLERMTLWQSCGLSFPKPKGREESAAFVSGALVSVLAGCQPSTPSAFCPTPSPQRPTGSTKTRHRRPRCSSTA